MLSDQKIHVNCRRLATLAIPVINSTDTVTVR
jgi:hypothetical protein